MNFFLNIVSYGVIAVARSALLTVVPKTDGKIFGQDPAVVKMLKGMFKR